MPRSLRVRYMPFVAVILALGAFPLLGYGLDNGDGPLGGQRSALAKRMLDRDPALALANTHDALSHAFRSNNLATVHVALLNKADEEHKLGLLPEYLQTCKDALQVASEMEDVLLLASDLQNLSAAYRLNQMYTQSLAEARNSLAIAIPTQNEIAITAAQHYLVRTLIALKRYDEGDRVVLSIMKSSPAPRSELAMARMNLMHAEVMIGLERTDDALRKLMMIRPELDRIGSTNDRFMVRSLACDIHLANGRTVDAENSLQDAVAHLPENELSNYRTAISKSTYDIALAKGQWQQALILLQEIQQRKDSVSAAQTNLKMAALQALYLSDTKEKDNAALRDANARNLEIITGQRFSNKVLWVTTFVILLVVIALIITSRSSIRLMRLMRVKNQMINKQHDEIVQKNMELEDQNLKLIGSMISEEEQAMMIKATHHHVKNNLQVIESLLIGHCNSAADLGSNRFLQEAQGRIRAMAHVHDIIHSANNSNKHTIGDHFTDLVRNILIAHGVHDRLSVAVKADAPPFSIEVMMPLSLILNEWVSASVNAVLDGQEIGSMGIALRSNGADHELIFRTNAVRTMETRLGRYDTRTFSTELVNSLVSQLNGDLRELDGEGTSYRFTFRTAVAAMRMAS